MDYQAIQQKYSTEQTRLETQIQSLKAEALSLREKAGVSPEATLEQIKQISDDIKKSLIEKEEQLQKLISDLEGDE